MPSGSSWNKYNSVTQGIISSLVEMLHVCQSENGEKYFNNCTAKQMLQLTANSGGPLINIRTSWDYWVKFQQMAKPLLKGWDL